MTTSSAFTVVNGPMTPFLAYGVILTGVVAIARDVVDASTSLAVSDAPDASYRTAVAVATLSTWSPSSIDRSVAEHE